MLFGPILRLWLTGSPMRDDWSRDFALAFSVVLWLCCDVLRLIVMLNWLLFCIMRFHIKRKSSRVVSSGCSVPSCVQFRSSTEPRLFGGWRSWRSLHLGVATGRRDWLAHRGRRTAHARVDTRPSLALHSVLTVCPSDSRTTRTKNRPLIAERSPGCLAHPTSAAVAYLGISAHRAEAMKCAHTSPAPRQVTKNHE